jgi:hypothetical protein
MDFECRLLRAIHTPVSSRIPQMLSERNAFDTAMQAMVQAHSANPAYGQLLEDAGASTRLQMLLASTEAEGRATLATASTNPFDVMLQRQVTDILARGLVAMRSIFMRTSPRGVLQIEAARLIEVLGRTAIDSQLDYLVVVDNLWCQYTQLWGCQQTMELLKGGTLSGLLPTVVRRLTPDFQDRALSYWNSVVHGYMTDRCSPSLPDFVRGPLMSALHSQTLLQPQQVDYDGLELMSLYREKPFSSAAMQDLAAAEPMANASSRFLTGPDDLHTIMEIMLVYSHWRPFMDVMKGSYSRVITSKHSGAYSVELDGAQESSSSEDEE